MTTTPTLTFLVPERYVGTFSALMQSIWGNTPQVLPTPPEQMQTQKGGGATDLVTLTCAVLGGAKAAIDLNDRFQWTTKIRQMISGWREVSKGRSLGEGATRTDVLIRLPGGRTHFLVDCDPADIVTVLTRQT